MQVHRELVRIKSLSTLLDQVGQDENLYEIFVDATEEVFGSISGAIERGERDDSFLIELFNDEYNSNAIITHFRVSESFSPEFILSLLSPFGPDDHVSTANDGWCSECSF